MNRKIRNHLASVQVNNRQPTVQLDRDTNKMHSQIVYLFPPVLVRAPQSGGERLSAGDYEGSNQRKTGTREDVATESSARLCSNLLCQVFLIGIDSERGRDSERQRQREVQTTRGRDSEMWSMRWSFEISVEGTDLTPSEWITKGFPASFALFLEVDTCCAEVSGNYLAAGKTKRQGQSAV